MACCSRSRSKPTRPAGAGGNGGDGAACADAPARIPPAAPRGLRADRCGIDLIGALDQANYCIGCHNQGKDSCSKGLRDRKTGAFQKTPFGVTLAGCPLEEKISEMNTVKSGGPPVGALAMIVVDNPCARRPGTASATTA